MCLQQTSDTYSKQINYIKQTFTSLRKVSYMQPLYIQEFPTFLGRSNVRQAILEDIWMKLSLI